MSKKASFGIGCYHFGIRWKEKVEFSGKKYIDDLKSSLSKIPSLDELKITCDNRFEDYVETLDEIPPDIGGIGGFYPYANRLFISFKLYIPYRIQTELCGREQKFIRTHTETFKVTIMQGYNFPVAIIETINPLVDDNYPSSGVQIVREFIKQELTEDRSPNIEFQCLGPSPFHLDCFLKPRLDEENDNWLFAPEEVIKFGYNKIVVNYNSYVFKSVIEAFDEVQRSIKDEFSYYYKWVQIKNEKIHTWNDIQVLLESIQNIQEMKGIRGFFLNLLKRPKLIGQLYTELGMMESRDIWISGLLRDSYKKTFKVKDETIFKTFIDAELGEKTTYPIKQVADLIKFYEERRVKSIELTIVIIAAILGGSIGAFLTIYFNQG